MTQASRVKATDQAERSLPPLQSRGRIQLATVAGLPTKE